MKKIIFFASLIFSIGIHAQSVSCEDLMDYVTSKGYNFQSVNSYQLYESSWLNSVKAYKVEGRIAVIAEIKRDDVGFFTKKYVFCGISKSRWDYFYYGLYDIGKSYGERFHKYIIDYQCNCY